MDLLLWPHFSATTVGVDLHVYTSISVAIAQGASVFSLVTYAMYITDGTCS